MRIKSSIVVATLVFAGVLVCVGWRFISVHPVYSGSHSHASEDSHHHVHTHDGDGSHGHDHIGRIGNITHSHRHVHAHVHEGQIGTAATDGLTEIGHAHQNGEISFFWARAEKQGNEIVVTFWTNQGSDLVKVFPDQQERQAKIYNGFELICDVTLVRSNESLVGNVPNRYVHLPTQTIAIADLAFEGLRMDASIPLNSP